MEVEALSKDLSSSVSLTREERKKKEFSDFLCNREKYSSLRSVDQSVELHLHGSRLQFNFFDPKLLDLLRSCFPTRYLTENSFREEEKNIHPTTQINWYSTEQLGWSWDGSGDHLCDLSKMNETERLVVQRDFVCHHSIDNSRDQSITLVTDTDLDDGPFNFLRYYLPFLLLQTGRFILHSACVLDRKQEEATVFLGHSGFGKTTISSMFPRERVLGDDMHVIFLQDEKAFIEATTLGQTVTNWDQQGETYPVKKVLWLDKSAEVKFSKVDNTRQRLCLLGSLSGVFWDHLSPQEVSSVFEFTKTFLDNNSINKFSFALDSDVEEEIENYV